MGERLLEAVGLTSGHRGVPVVRDLDLHVDAGEVVVLFGPNGAGKSTTLQTVSGLLPPLGGTVRVAGAPVDVRRPHRNARRGLAHVAEDRSLFTDLTVAENLCLGARGRARRQVVDEAVARFPRLGELVGRRAGLLSGGEQQMLALARAFVGHPRVLAVDEMSLGLAPLLVQELLPALREAADGGAAVLVVEQHVELALRIADRGVVLAHGRVVARGSARELASRPDLLAAAYLGDEAL